MTDFWNPLSSTGGDYFTQLKHLMELRQQAAQHQPSAGDLIDKLDVEAQRSGYDRVGALYRGVSSDEFFRDHLRFAQLENQLASNISPKNVREAFDLMQFAGYYAPTNLISQTLRRNFQILINNQPRSGGLQSDIPSQRSPFKPPDA